MSASNLVHNDTIIFVGTNYHLWRNCLLCKLRTLCPNIEQFLDVGFSPPMDPQNLSLEDEKNLHLEAQVSNELLFSLRPDFRRFLIYIKRKSSHEMWIKRKSRVGLPLREKSKEKRKNNPWPLPSPKHEKTSVTPSQH